MPVRPRLVAFALVPIAALVLLLAAGASSGRGAANVQTDERPVGPTAVVLPAADPMAIEMQREIEQSQRDYATLFHRLSLAGSETDAFAIQEEMRQQRTGLQIALLRIQCAYARRAGHTAFAAQVERAIDMLIAADRPANATDERRKL